MPTTSSYYSDLEYPTVNEDASTYGSIINTYLDGLLGKLKTVSDRVTNSQAQLGNINRGTNAVDNLNTTLSGAIGSSALLPSTGTTLLPDPYSGTYTKTTSWPAFTSELASYSPPTTQSEVENFNYQGFAAALTTELNRIDATVTQAEADLLAAQKDTCRAKKYVDAYQTGGTLETYYAGDTGGYNGGYITANFTISALSGTSSSRTVQLSFSAGASGQSQITSYSDFRSFCTAASIPLNTAITVNNTFTGTSGYQGTMLVLQSATFFTMTIGPTLVEVSAGASGSLYDGAVLGLGSTVPVYIQRYYTATRTVYPTPDLTECENPNPPYFI
jgi:hypothetical protein